MAAAQGDRTIFPDDESDEAATKQFTGLIQDLSELDIDVARARAPNSYANATPLRIPPRIPESPNPSSNPSNPSLNESSAQILSQILQLLLLRFNIPPSAAYKGVTDDGLSRKRRAETMWASECAKALLSGHDPSIYWPYRRFSTNISYAPSIEDGVSYHQSSVSFEGTPVQIVKKAKMYYEKLAWEINGEIQQIPYNTDRSAFLRDQLRRVQSRLAAWN
jgi:hypothetical protein